MPITINGSGTVTGITAGGLPDAIITTAEIADANVTQAKLATGVAGNGPAFHAYQSTAQTGLSTAWTKISLQAEVFDTNSNFDSTTDYRFLPTVAGYYMFICGVYFVTSGINNYISIYRNGSPIVYGTAYPTASGASNPYTNGSTLAYMNGTTDYVELYGYATNTWSTGTGTNSTYLQGFLARAA
jgi:hypothetical protein